MAKTIHMNRLTNEDYVQRIFGLRHRPARYDTRAEGIANLQGKMFLVRLVPDNKFHLRPGYYALSFHDANTIIANGQGDARIVLQ